MFVDLRIYCLLLAIVKVPYGEAKNNVKPIGDVAKLEDYPFLVYLSVEYPVTPGPLTSLPFGGAYIRPLWVLTAGLVLRNISMLWLTTLPHDAVECRMGLRRADPESLRAAPAIRSKLLLTHPDMKLLLKSPNEANIGLVLLERPFGFSKTIGMVNLPPTVGNYVDKDVTLVGYSGIFILINALIIKKSNKYNVGPEHMKLRKLTAKTKKCHLGRPDHICIGHIGGSSAWAYDVGGPLLYNNQLIAIAVPDWSSKNIGEYATYQILGPYKAWIDASITSNVEKRMSADSVHRVRAISLYLNLNLAVVYLIKSL